MDARRAGRVGAVLLVLGGLLEAASFAVGTVVSLPGTTLFGATLLYGFALGSVFIGIGLITIGAALHGGGRTALIVAGVLALIVPIVNALQSATGAPLGPAPSQLAYLLFILAVVVAALTLLLNREQRRGVRWSLAAPAACFLLSVVTLFLPLPALPGTIVLPWLGLAVTGVLLFKGWTGPVVAAPHV